MYIYILTTLGSLGNSLEIFFYILLSKLSAFIYHFANIVEFSCENIDNKWLVSSSITSFLSSSVS